MIVEVDEFQHSRYSCSIEGEMRRLITLFEEDSGGFPLMFIRFNPDPYYEKGKGVTAYKFREKILTDTIKGLKNRTEIDAPINVIYLFYDNFEEVVIEPLKYNVKNGKLKISHNHPHAYENKFIFPL